MHRSKEFFDDLVGPREQLIRDFRWSAGGLDVDYPRRKHSYTWSSWRAARNSFGSGSFEAFQVSGVFTISDIDRRGFDVR